MFTAKLRFYGLLFLPTFFVVAFSSCSNVNFQQAPGTKCNSSDLSCSTAIENGQQVNIYSYDVSVPYPKTDILFVVDNSLSMAPEQKLLADGFHGFAQTLAGVDWQIGVTTTDTTSTGMGGKLVKFSGTQN